MLFLAVSGAAVVTVVWLAAMRDAAQRTRPFIPQAEPRSQTGAMVMRPLTAGAKSPAETCVGGAPHVGALRDATVADADTEEALAAAAGLWEVLTQHRH